MTNQTLISIVIGIVTLVLSVGATATIVGVAWGKVTRDISYMKETLAEIKGMFHLTPKE